MSKVTPPGPAGAESETVKVKFVGDIGGEFEQEIQLPSTPQEKYGIFASQPETPNPKLETKGSLLTSAATIEELTAPSPNWMRVTPFPTALEAEPNDTREPAGAARDVPVVFNGVLGKPGDHDWFRFHATKGTSLQVTVFARRLRSPVDSVIQILNIDGFEFRVHGRAGTTLDARR